jgi:hypothetical protein
LINFCVGWVCFLCNSEKLNDASQKNRCKGVQCTNSN